MLRLSALALLVTVAGCANLPISVPDTARLQPGELGIGINGDVASVNLAQWAFASPARIRNRPVDAARAAGAMEYVAGSLNTNPGWANISILTKEQLLQGRVEVRQALGVAPGAPSQAVVDRLSATAEALQRNDQTEALRDLGPPVFVASPPAILARLYDMPYLQMANVSTMRAANELFGPGEQDWH